MNILHQKLKDDFVLQAIKLILSIFYLDLCLQGHIGDLKATL